MADIHIDTRALTCKHFSIPGQVGVTDGSAAPVVSLAPGVYDFQQFIGDLAAFRFEVTPEGLIQYDTLCNPFVSGRGSTTLTVTGYELAIDARALSHDLRFYGMIGDTPVLPNTAVNKVRLIPGDGYLMQPGVLVADFRFDLTIDGGVVVDPKYAGFTQVTGRSIAISGYKVSIDARSLSHSLSMYGLFGAAINLPNTAVNEFTLIPGKGYLMQPGVLVADFAFDLTADGRVEVDPKYAGFTQITGRTLTVGGYRIAVDARQLPHNLVLYGVFGSPINLAADSVTEMTLVPGNGYLFSLGSLVADLHFGVTPDGHLSLEPRYAGFAQIEQTTRPTLVLQGYKVTFDGLGLSDDLVSTSIFGGPIVLTRDRAHELALLPAVGYVLATREATDAMEFHFAVDTEGRLRPA